MADRKRQHWRRTGWVCATAVMFSAIALTMCAAPAAAHAVLVSSAPRDGELLPVGQHVTVVALRFDEPVEVSVGSVQVVEADGKRVDTGRVYHPDAASRNVTVDVRDGLAHRER